MADLLGYDLDELTQLKARDVAGRNDLAEVDPIYKRLMKGEQVFGEAVLRRKDGVLGTIKYRAMNGSSAAFRCWCRSGTRSRRSVRGSRAGGTTEPRRV